MLAAVKVFMINQRQKLNSDMGEFIEVPEAKKRTPKVEDV